MSHSFNLQTSTIETLNVESASSSKTTRETCVNSLITLPIVSLVKSLNLNELNDRPFSNANYILKSCRIRAQCKDRKSFIGLSLCPTINLKIRILSLNFGVCFTKSFFSRFLFLSNWVFRLSSKCWPVSCPVSCASMTTESRRIQKRNLILMAAGNRLQLQKNFRTQ